MSNISGINGLPASIPQVTSSEPALTDGLNFNDTLHQAIEQVDQLQSDAHGQIADLMQGKGQDLHNVMIAVEKADVAFQLMMQVRNKIVNAYEEISKMQF